MTTIGIDARAASEEPAGRGRVVRELLDALARRQDPVRYVLYALSPHAANLDERFSWRCRRLPDPLWHLWAAFAATRECNVFLSTNSYLTPWFLRIPTAVIVYDLVAFQTRAAAQRRAARIERATIKRGLRRSGAVVCISEATRADLIARFPWVARRTSVLPLAADPRFAQQLSAAEQLPVLARYGLGERFILATGTLEPRKNLVRVIDAHAALAESLRETHPLVLVGPRGWESDEIVARAGADDRLVRILGHVPDEDLAVLYGACTVFSYPSLYEGFGLPLLEAMAAGAACITSNVSSLPEVGGDAVVYVDPLSVDEITGALENLLTSDETRADLGERAARRAAGFSWDRTATGLLERLLELRSQSEARV
jgi:glycosyltransferase involved in cell wall biosynthesis